MGARPAQANFMPAADAGGDAVRLGGPAMVARIGPNAIIQTGHAMRAYGGPEFERDIFLRSGLARYLQSPPDEMIAEGEAIALFNGLYRHAGVTLSDANAIARDAGLRTGDYILANRIPKPAQTVLKFLPKPLAARALLSAIGKHSWTFAGSGRFESRYGRPLVVEIARNPLAFDACAWHCAVFERLFGALVSRQVHVAYGSRDDAGGKICHFEISV